MKIGIIGAGPIGTTLAERLAAAGHEVAIANSRGPETIADTALSTGARAVDATVVANAADVLIVSVPFNRVPDVAPLVQHAPGTTVVVDTSNYVPVRDGRIEAVDAGQTESLWVSERYGRPVIKAWNAITSASFDDHAMEAGSPGRLAIPVAGDDHEAQRVAMTLVEETGFDAVASGPLSESWRHQPGTPAYCTDRTAAELPAVLSKADAARSPLRRDLAMAVLSERLEAEGTLSADYLLGLTRAVY